MGEARRPEDRYIEANGLRLHYLDWGGDSERVVLLLHGGSGNSHDWDRLAVDLCEKFRVLAPDQRGHGDSDWSREGYWPWQLAADLEGLVEKTGLGQFDIVSQSMGVWTAIAYAGDHSDRIGRLVLTDFGPEVGRDVGRGINKTIAQRPSAFRDKQEAVAFLRQIYPTRPVKLLEDRVEYGMRVNWAGKVVWKHDQEFTWITGSTGKKAQPYLWDQLARIQCPTLVVRGGESVILPEGVRDQMVGMLSHGSTAEIEGGSHFLLDEQPERYVKAVRDYLAG